MEPVKIDIYISDLLYSYDCVIVPDFGGFVANYAPAKIKEVQHQFLPPSKQISFNKNLKNNDGLLTNHISQRQKISFQEANQLIRAFVDRSLMGLKNGDKIKIDKVGTLYLDPEANIQFIEEDQNDFLLDSFGLQSFRALPIERDTVEEKIQEKLSSGRAYHKIEKGSANIVWKVAAGVFFLLTSALLLNQQMNGLDLDELQYSFFTPGINEEKSYKPNESELKIEESKWEMDNARQFDQNGVFRYQAVGEEPSSIWVAAEESIVETKVDNTKVEAVDHQMGSFHVIGGCFSQLDNAKKLKSRLEALGHRSRLLGTYKDLHTVSYASFSTKEEADNYLKKVKRSHNSSAWILKKSF